MLLLRQDQDEIFLLILGKDFESVWGAIEITLIKDEEGNYFIEWLENSEIKAKKQSLARLSNNGSSPG